MCLKNAGKVKEPRGAPPAGDQKPSVTPAAAPPAPQQDQAEKPIIYAAIVMTVPVGVKALVPADYMEGKEAVENLHITTMFLGGKPPEDVEMFSELEKLEGKTIDVTLVRVVSDAKATAIEVRNNNEFPCQNKHAHITVGLAPGVPAKYSNELLDDSLQHEGERNVLEIPPDTSLPGVFQFVRMLQPSAKYRRGEACVNFQRSRVCPTAVRAYRFMSEDVSSQMDLCSTVLRVPPAGLIGAPPTARGAEEEAHQPLMLITWEDTTPAEIAMSLLDKVRRDVDLTFASTESETNATLEKSDSVNKAEVSEDGMNHGGKSSTAVYIIKLSAGYVGVEGKATLSLITCVELRQVVSGEPYVFPSRRAGMPNVDVPISTLSYRLGDPIFFTCKRLR